jgi:hypothetical protein
MTKAEATTHTLQKAWPGHTPHSSALGHRVFREHMFQAVKFNTLSEQIVTARRIKCK